LARNPGLSANVAGEPIRGCARFASTHILSEPNAAEELDMARESSTPRNRRLRKVEASPALDERWKTTPSTEVTSDEGNNARVERRRKSEENLPSRHPAPRPRPGGRRG
jgi:hypothetical protein